MIVVMIGICICMNDWRYILAGNRHISLAQHSLMRISSNTYTLARQLLLETLGESSIPLPCIPRSRKRILVVQPAFSRHQFRPFCEVFPELLAPLELEGDGEACPLSGPGSGLGFGFGCC